MWTLADQTLCLLTTLVEAYAVCLFLIQGLFRKFLFFNFYLLLRIFINIGRYYVLHQFGLASPEYRYFYYYCDAPLTLSLFVCVCELSLRVVVARVPRRGIVFWSAGAFLATVWFSFAIASFSGHRITYFLLEFTQNIYFVCCLAIVLLGIWKLRNDSEDRIAARLVNVLAVYFFLFLVVHGVRQLVPYETSGLNNVYPMIGAWLPIGCGFAVVTRQ